jgi:hypothetical protein
MASIKDNNRENKPADITADKLASLGTQAVAPEFVLCVPAGQGVHEV